MDRKVILGVGLAVFLMVGLVFTSAQIFEDSEEVVVEESNTFEESTCGAGACGSSCDGACGGNCGIRSCGCGR